MSIRVWFNIYDTEMLYQSEPVKPEHYAGEGKREIVTAETDNVGMFSHLKSKFVLGRVLFWEKKGSKHRVPFIRVDNHRAYPDGIVFSPEDWINVRFHHNSKTIDEVTKLTRVQLLTAPDQDFVHRVFITYDSDALVCKPSEFEKHLLVYCNSRHLFNGCVSEKP